MMRVSARIVVMVGTVSLVVSIVVLMTGFSNNSYRGHNKASTEAKHGRSKEILPELKHADAAIDLPPLMWKTHIQRECDRLGLGESSHLDEDFTPQMMNKILVDDTNKLLYCQIAKVATTTWRRIFIFLSGKVNTSNIMSLNANDVHHKYDDHLKYLSDFTNAEIDFRLRHYFKFVFAREPFERLLSAFRNKFEYTNAGYFQKSFGRKIIQRYRKNPSEQSLLTGKDLTFEEFIRYLIDPKRTLPLNEHWERFHQLCHPCKVKYDFIGKLSDINRDSDYIMKKTGLVGKVKFPTKSEARYFRPGTDTYMKSYYSKIPKSSLLSLYKMYQADFDIFNFTVPEDIKSMIWTDLYTATT